MPATRLLRLTAAAGIASIAGTALAAPARLSLRHESIDLPGPPAAVISADLDKDGRSDLVIVAAYTKWGSIAHDRTENAIAVT